LTRERVLALRQQLERVLFLFGFVLAFALAVANHAVIVGVNGF
jgi:hypothetical protein